ncbi:MAG: hypothetical protein JWP05_77 [Microbacteriaceae bacterium]|jgi:hypothetical protein|nr:hypothetical protein [Microbacteriaceae bacterium]
MTSASPEALDLLHHIAMALENDGPIEIGTMFRSPGLRTRKTIVAFLGHDDRLIIKLPRARAVALVGDGVAEPVTMGTRTMREWIAIPADTDPEATQATWTKLAREAFSFVRQQLD